MTQAIKKYWRGEEKLWKVFWIWNFPLPLLLPISVGFITFSLLVPGLLFFIGINDNSQDITYDISYLNYLNGLIGLVSIGFIVAYTIWALVSLWRSAFNCSKAIFGYLARVWVIFVILLFTVPSINDVMNPDSENNFSDENNNESLTNKESS